jgi:hypothetical protein
VNTTTRIEFSLVPRSNLAAQEKAEMFQLLAEHFDGVTPEQFARDLAEKNLTLLLRRGKTLVGFSTLLSYTTSFEGTNVNIIYSGDTIVTPEAWGTTALPRAWVAGVDALRAALPPGRCFWLLLTSGFRTYRFLPVFWREFFPRFDTATPPETLRLLNQLATERFGQQFDSYRGTVQFRHPQKLRPELNDIPSGRKNDPHIAFFLSQNPGCVHGYELVCLTELSPENLTAAGRRMMNPQVCATQSDHS